MSHRAANKMLEIVLYQVVDFELSKKLTNNSLEFVCVVKTNKSLKILFFYFILFYKQ